MNLCERDGKQVRKQRGDTLAHSHIHKHTYLEFGEHQVVNDLRDLQTLQNWVTKCHAN